MTVGPVMGSRGDVSIERVQFHPVKTTWQQTIRLAAGWSIAYVCGLLVVILVIWFGWGWDWAWWIVRRIALLLPVPVVAIFGISFARAARHYYSVVQKVPNWPPPQTQVNPLESGIVGARDFPVYAPEQEERVIVQFEGSVFDNDNNGAESKHWRLNTEYPVEWQRFAKALAHPVPFLRPRFSIRSARTYHIPDDEFTALQQGWTRGKIKPFAKRTGRAKNSHTKLTRWGRGYMRNLSTTPLPDHIG